MKLNPISRIVLNQKGITLVEIMIVLIIIGGIAGAMVNNVIGNLEKSRFKEARIQINQLGQALDLYNADCGDYPSTADGLGALIQAPTTCPDWGGPYLSRGIKSVPKDPWGREYQYDYEGDYYTITSLGKNVRDDNDNVSNVDTEERVEE